MVWITTPITLPTLGALVSLLPTGGAGVVLRVGGRFVTRLVFVLTFGKPALNCPHEYTLPLTF